MRVWDIHPGYLSRQSLLGQHAEIHALYSVISGTKKGYSKHPETKRWNDKLGGLVHIHDLTVLEMQLRGFNHVSPCEKGAENCSYPGSGSGPVYVDPPAEQIEILFEKYRQNDASGRIPLPGNAFEFWAHHKYSVMARGYNYYKEIQAHLRGKEKYPLPEAGPFIEQILKIIKEPVTTPALANVVDHLWGYFKNEASPEEKEIYLRRKTGDLPHLVNFFYTLARKYNRVYLLHSTIFADFTG